MTETNIPQADQAVLDPFTQGLLNDAKRFDQDALDKASKMQRRMLALLILFTLLCAASVITSAYLAVTKKEVQPYVLVKDDKTGVVQELIRVEPQQWTHGDAIDAAYIGQYVRAREEYSDASAVFNYETVELMSSAVVSDEYRQWLDPSSNKLSPVALYPAGIVDIEINSVVRMGKGAAQVFFTRRVKGVSNAPAPSSRIAMVEYEYLTKNMTLQARLRNPLGMTVRAYSVDESVPRSTQSSIAAPPSLGGQP